METDDFMTAGESPETPDLYDEDADMDFEVQSGPGEDGDGWYDEDECAGSVLSAADQQRGQDPREEDVGSFELKHLGSVRRVTRDEAVALAQKGLDYDRIRSDRDSLTAFKRENEETVAALREAAAAQGAAVPEFLDSMRIGQLMCAEGLDEKNARTRLELEKREKMLESREGRGKSAEELKNARRSAEVKEFIAEYPGVDAGEIPREVWGEVRRGKSLIGAYTAYENRRLRQSLQAEKQNKSNAQRSTGSRSTAGRGGARDDYAYFFDNDN